MDKLINEIISNNTHCYFISPHLDDAAFSAGGLICHLAGKVPVTVINVFTSGGDQNTLSARAFLKQSNEKSAATLFEKRIAEDFEALGSIGVGVQNFGYSDALWRKHKNVGKIKNILSEIAPEFSQPYPIYRKNIVSGRVHSEEKWLVEEIAKKLKEIISDSEDNYLVFCPVGIGGHVDHIVVREACQSNFSKIVYWADFPYRLKARNNISFVSENSLTAHFFKIRTDEKEKFCKQYKNQIRQVIPNMSMLFEPEIYFTSKNVGQLLGVSSEIKSEITSDFIAQWQDLWQRSSLKHYFNSPSWFLACRNAFSNQDFKIVTTFAGEKLVGVFPLVVTSRYGVKAYCAPGKQYLDRSCLLMENFDVDVLKEMFDAISKIGNVYLLELPEFITYYLKTFYPKFSTSYSSINFELPLGDDPLRYLNSKHRKQIKKQIADEGENFKTEIYLCGAAEKLPVISEIESESGKNSDNKEVFVQPEMQALAKQLGEFSNEDCLVSVLFYLGEPICYEYGFVCNSTWHLFQMGFKDKYRLLSPGKVLLFLTLPKISQMGINLVDFSRGSNRLKRDFTPHYYYQYLAFFSPNVIIKHWWKSVAFCYAKLEQLPGVFEIARHLKHIVIKS